MGMLAKDFSDLLGAVSPDSTVRPEVDDALLRKRMEHLQAEHDTLRASHAEAAAAAVEQREQRLREQQEHTAQLQAVMMMAADGILTIDEQGTIDSFNEAAGWIFGYRPEEVVGQPVGILLPEELRERHREHLVTHLRHCPPGAINLAREVLGRRKNGSVFPLDIAVSEVCVGDRRLFTGIFRDITERKRAEQELHRLNLQKEMILNSAGEGICGVDAQCRAMFVNPAAARMLGYAPGALIGRPLHQAIHHSKPDGSPYRSGQCPLCRVLAGSDGSHFENEVFWRHDGTSFPVEFSCQPIHEDEQVVGAVLTFRDVSERRMLEAQLRQAQKLESIGQLAAGIAHEINTPTQYIGDNTRFLRDVFGDVAQVLDDYRALLDAVKADTVEPSLIERVEQGAEAADIEFLRKEIPAAIGQTLEGVDHVTRIVRSMKEFSHPGGDEKQAIDLNQAIRSTLTVSRNEWKYVADVVTDLDDRLPPVYCLPSDFNQVVLNLVVNAAHAIAEKLEPAAVEKGTITIQTRRDGEMVDVIVADTGAGIPAAVRGRIFDPFFTTKAVGQGTGQGLAIVHSIVTERHGGSIRFETEPGRGTRFVVRLPINSDVGFTERGKDEKHLVCR